MTIVEKPFQPSEPQEIPLSPANRMLAGLGIIVVLFLAYVYLSLSLALVLALLLLDLALVIPALRVGMAGYFATALTRQFHLARVLVRGLRLQDSPEFSVPLEREDAPRLYALLEELVGKMGVPPPAEVLLMMELNAGVRVQGYRSGRVGSKVTLGFDLFAACTEDQIRAILAHELAHAKLIQPGFNGWRINAMSRIAQVGGAVAELDESSRESKTNFYTARLIERGLRMIARAGSRLAALHSRQHEFLADALAVQVAGAATFREALLRTHLALQAMGDLDHRDRLIQSQREDSFTEWLTSRMVVKP